MGKQNSLQLYLTSANCETGTDRIAEANITLKADIVINVQGDEPMIDPNVIKMSYKTLLITLMK